MRFGRPVRYLITPVPKPRMTQRDKWRKRACVLRYWAFRDKCRLARVLLPESARVTFWLPMPRSWPESLKARSDGEPHRSKPDVDNLCKALLDAVYGSDAHIAVLTIVKRWARVGAIEIEPALPD